MTSQPAPRKNAGLARRDLNRARAFFNAYADNSGRQYTAAENGVRTYRTDAELLRKYRLERHEAHLKAQRAGNVEWRTTVILDGEARRVLNTDVRADGMIELRLSSGDDGGDNPELVTFHPNDTIRVA